MPQHGHSGSISNTSLTGEAYATGPELNFSGYSGILTLYKARDTFGGGHKESGGPSAGIRINASHSHNITINNVGGNKKHENRQPFEVVARWKRTN